MEPIKYEMLTVVERLKGSKYLCKCDCGNTRIINVGHFNARYFKSCGCHTNRHGHTKGYKKTREYNSYYNMIARCTNPSNKRFKDYGEKGITVCDRWLSSFNNFINDMGECPDGYQIDRIDNEKGYSPKNCRWVSRMKNQSNRSNSRIYTVFGVDYSSSTEAAEKHGVKPATIIHWCGLRKYPNGSYRPAKDDCSWRWTYEN
ncbi:hypothetical protein I6M31_11200 [Shewanella algae]|nr:hypothetical protein [Shewanella algae]